MVTILALRDHLTRTVAQHPSALALAEALSPSTPGAHPSPERAQKAHRWLWNALFAETRGMVALVADADTMVALVRALTVAAADALPMLARFWSAAPIQEMLSHPYAAGERIPDPLPTSTPEYRHTRDLWNEALHHDPATPFSDEHCLALQNTAASVITRWIPSAPRPGESHTIETWTAVLADTRTIQDSAPILNPVLAFSYVFNQASRRLL